MQHESNEPLRKSLHIAFGLFALTLRWLPWWVAAGVAGMAVLGNWLVLHKIVGTRVSRSERGWDAGIIIYPAVVALLIIIFRNHLVIAGLVWATMAFGDGFATIAGRNVGGPHLPWNHTKTWSGLAGFVVFGFIGAYLVSGYLSDDATYWPRWVIVLIAVLAGAIAESLPLAVDDNILVPVASSIAATILLITTQPHYQLDNSAFVWLGVNAVLAILGYMMKTVDLSGMIGGLILGAIIIICGSPRLYLVMLAFFVIGTAATRLGFRKKSEEGLAQEKGGRRGFGHAFANVGVAALCAVAIAMTGGLSSSNAIVFWAAVASLATAGADTVASEIGSLLGRRTFLPTTFKTVPRGTEGAISIEGTLAGIAAALVIAAVGARGRIDVILTITACAAIGSYIESILGNLNRRRGLGIANGALNFFNTLVGALLVLLAAPSLQWMQTP